MYFSKGTQKPPLGAIVNREHPFGKDLRFAGLFNEGFSNPTVSFNRGPFPVWGGSFPLLTYSIILNGTTSWTGNTAGTALKLVNGGTSSYLQMTSYSPSVPDLLPANAVTVCLIRRKTDLSITTVGLFGHQSATSTARRLGAWQATTTLNWDFGGNSGINRLTATGVTFTTLVESYIFTAGPTGMSIWQNGIKLASSATAVTRTATGDGPFRINYGIESGVTTTDNQEVNFFQVISQQWSDEMCRWWSATPYAHFYPSDNRYAIVSASPTGFAHSQVVII